MGSTIGGIVMVITDVMDFVTDQIMVLVMGVVPVIGDHDYVTDASGENVTDASGEGIWGAE